MKRILNLLAAFILMQTLLSFTSVPGNVTGNVSRGKNILNTQETPYYKLKLKQVFKAEQRNLIDEKLKSLNAPFVMEDVNYDEKSVIIRLNAGAKLKEAISVFENLLGADYTVIEHTSYSK